MDKFKYNKDIFELVLYKSYMALDAIELACDLFWNKAREDYWVADGGITKF